MSQETLGSTGCCALKKLAILPSELAIGSTGWFRGRIPVCLFSYKEHIYI